MNKKSYLDLLKYYLSDLPNKVVEDIIYDYDQHFEEGISQGKTEEQISEELGSAEDLAKEFLSFETRSRKTLANNPKNEGESKVSNNIKYILIAIGLLALSPLILGIIGTVIGLIGSLFGLGLALIGAGIGLALGGLGGAVVGFPIWQISIHPLTQVLFVLFLIALGIFLLMLVVKFIIWIVKMLKNLYISIKWELEK